jgi:hypothetical protein
VAASQKVPVLQLASLAQVALHAPLWQAPLRHASALVQLCVLIAPHRPSLPHTPAWHMVSRVQGCASAKSSVHNWVFALSQYVTLVWQSVSAAQLATQVVF